VSVKLGRYVFRKIGGRIIPIRVGAEAKTLAKGAAGVSKSIMKKAAILFRGREFKAGSNGKILRAPNYSPTDSMLKFMDQTGAVRFSQSDDTMIDISRKLSEAQKMKLAQVSKGKVHADINNPKIQHLKGGTFNSFGEAYRKALLLGPKELKKENTKAVAKAVKQLGTTSNPQEAGYILRDGRMLDLSGKRDGGPSGVRYLDHREVAGIIPFRWKKAKPRDISDYLSRAQKDRKNIAQNKHLVTNNKNYIKKLWPERKEWRDVIRDFAKQIRRRKPKQK